MPFNNQTHDYNTTSVDKLKKILAVMQDYLQELEVEVTDVQDRISDLKLRISRGNSI